MNNRGTDRGVIQQPLPPAVRQGPPPHHRPHRSGQQMPRGPQPDVATRPNRPDGPGYRDPLWRSRVSTGEATVPADRITTPAPVARQWPPRRIPLDSLEEQHSEDVPVKLTWRRLLARLTGVDLGLSQDQVYELELRDRIRVSVGSAFPIAVLNLKGGVGKTIVVEA